MIQGIIGILATKLLNTPMMQKFQDEEDAKRDPFVISRSRPTPEQVAEHLIAATRGKFMGRCNRKVCSTPNPVWYNHLTKRYYCRACALMINRANRAESATWFGHNVCQKDEHGTNSVRTSRRQ